MTRSVLTSSIPRVHVDFTIEVERSLRVLDGAVALLMRMLVLSRKLKQFGVRQINITCRVCSLSTRWIVLGADFYAVLIMIKDRLGCEAVILQLLLVLKMSLKVLLILLKMKAIVWQEEELLVLKFECALIFQQTLLIKQTNIVRK